MLVLPQRINLRDPTRLFVTSFFSTHLVITLQTGLLSRCAQFHNIANGEVILAMLHFFVKEAVYRVETEWQNAPLCLYPLPTQRNAKSSSSFCFDDFLFTAFRCAVFIRF